MDNFTGLIKFSAEWCAPCKTLSPIVKKVAEESGIELKDIDIDDEPELAKKFNVRSIPVTFAMVAGEAVDFITGSADEERIKKLAEKVI